ncbi:MAG: hypothetical protein ACREMA_07730 [Longimicrobiales bacterium]
MASSPNFIGTPKVGLQNIVNADGATLKDLVSAGASGSKVVAVMIATDETAQREARLWLTRSATAYLLGNINVPIGAGIGGAAGVNLLSAVQIPGLPVDQDGQRYVLLESGDKIQISVAVAVTAAKTIWFSAVFGNF